MEYEGEPSSKVTSMDKSSDLRKKNVSFEKAELKKEKRVTKSGKTSKERWQWAYSRIVQVGIDFHFRCGKDSYHTSTSCLII